MLSQTSTNTGRRTSRYNITMDEKRILGFVPARGGSKSIPKKNIKTLGTKPLIHHTLNTIRDVKAITYSVVSTDDDDIARACSDFNVRLVKRPARLATDTSSTESAILHTLDLLQREGLTFDYVIVLEPTSPFRSIETIETCIGKIIKLNGNSLMTVVKTTSNIGRRHGDIFRPLNPNAPRRRQERDPYFIESSTVYVSSVKHLRSTGTLVSDNWLSVVVTEEEAIDINNPIDFTIAEAILNR